MKLAFYGLLLAGIVACSTLGIGRTLERVGGNWSAWPMFAGIGVGAAIIALAVGFGTGLRSGILATDREYVIALGSLIAVKVLVGFVSAATAAMARG